MATLLIYPGQTGDLVALQDLLREAHDALRASRQAEVDARQKANTPLDDETRWVDVGDLVLTMSGAVKARDSVRLAEIASEVVTATAGHTIEVPGPYVPDPDLDGITIRCQVISDAHRRQLTAQQIAAWRAVRDAGDVAFDAAAATTRLHAAYDELIASVVVEIGGVDGLRKSVRESLEGLRLAGLCDALFVAARHFLELPPGKALRSGRPPSST